MELLVFFVANEFAAMFLSPNHFFLLKMHASIVTGCDFY
jgi:hypothetical protein